MDAEDDALVVIAPVDGVPNENGVAWLNASGLAGVDPLADAG